MDFVKGYFVKNESLTSRQGGKSVQLVRGSFLSKYFLQNPYFNQQTSFVMIIIQKYRFKYVMNNDMYLFYVEF